MKTYLLVCSLILISATAMAVEMRGPQFKWHSHDHVSVSIYANMQVQMGLIYGIKGQAVEEWKDINNSHATQHHFNLRELKPDTDYQYIIKGANDNERVYNFRSSKQVEEQTVFCAYGQSRNQDIATVTHRQLINRIALEKPDFIVHTGNMLNGGQRGNPSLFGRDWTQNFFTPLAPLLNHLPFYIVPGQHDLSYQNGAESMHTVFPKLKRFTIQVERRGLLGLAIITLPHRLSEWKQRREEIELALQGLDGARWRVLCMHVPPYASGMRDWISDDGYGLWELLQRYRVDLVLSGRQPQYQRSVPIHLNKNVEHAITVINTGLGMHPLTVNDAYIAAKNDRLAHYVRVSCDKQFLRVQAKDVQGRILDNYTVDRHRFDLILDQAQLLPRDDL